MMMVHHIVLDLGGHLAMYMLGLVFLNVTGGESFRSTKYAVVDTRKNITLYRRETEQKQNN